MSGGNHWPVVCLDGMLATGVIFPGSTGVFWSNQVGGYHCGHPQLEGIFIPLPSLPDAGSLADPLLGRHEDHYDQILVAKWIGAVGLVGRVRPCNSINAAKLSEAWVPVTVCDRLEHWDPLLDFAGWTGVLVYPNSD